MASDGWSTFVAFLGSPGGIPHFSARSAAEVASRERYRPAFTSKTSRDGPQRPPRRSPANKPRLANEQFRAYADYMATPEFHAAVDRLLDLELMTAYMCAEAVPWRCHRNLLSDER